MGKEDLTIYMWIATLTHTFRRQIIRTVDKSMICWGIYYSFKNVPKTYNTYL